MRVVVSFGAQAVRVEVHGLEPRGARAANVIAHRIADVHGPLGLDAERLQSVAEDLSRRLGNADDMRVDDSQHWHAQT